ncbi:MAG: tetratricopeptide repeat protein, partial [Thiomargarita sp.]|nr:tetratricopeptide repeat protein [Thiomargarita sp.]
ALNHFNTTEAVHYFDALMTLPPAPMSSQSPTRDSVAYLCKQVDYHPLSLNILAFLAKTNSIDTLNTRLEYALKEQPAEKPLAEKSLFASINLFFDDLAPEVRQYLPKLGIFKDGAFENILQSIIEIPETLWNTLRHSLESAGLIQAEQVEGVKVPYLKFHSTLAMSLWIRLSTPDQYPLTDRYCYGYCELSNFLFEEDNQNFHQAYAIEQRELPNLLAAVQGGIRKKRHWALKFAKQVDSFLNDFGFKCDNDTLLAESAKPNYSKEWFKEQSKQAEQLYTDCNYHEAQELFHELLDHLGDKDGLDRGVALGWKGQCSVKKGELEQGTRYFKQSLQEFNSLEQSPQVQQETIHIQTDLGAVLKDQGDYQGATTAYALVLPMIQSTGDTQTEAAVQEELGTLELSQGNFQQSERHHRDALNQFRELKQPINEANALNHLGSVYKEAKQWKAAAHAYMSAATLYEEHNDLAKSAKNWTLLAQVRQNHGNLNGTEKAYRKAIETYKASENWLEASKNARALAHLLYQQPQRLSEAKQVAETALSIDKNLDPNTAEIWLIYELLANIAEQQNDVQQSQKYHNMAQHAKTGDTIPKIDLQEHQQFIDAVTQTIVQPKLRKQLDSMLQQREKKGWKKLVKATRHILKGERNLDRLCQKCKLDVTDAQIVQDILQKV